MEEVSKVWRLGEQTTLQYWEGFDASQDELCVVDLGAKVKLGDEAGWPRQKRQNV